VTQSFSVPAGRWRLSAINDGQYITHFCMGTSGFEATEGEAVYAGAFDLSSEYLRPDMTMRDDLSPPTSPAAMAGLRHRAADWSYGDTEQCQGAYLYALDLRPASAAPEQAGPAAISAADEQSPVIVVDKPASSTLQ
jgi:hypothetical protein